MSSCDLNRRTGDHSSEKSQSVGRLGLTVLGMSSSVAGSVLYLIDGAYGENGRGDSREPRRDVRDGSRDDRPGERYDARDNRFRGLRGYWAHSAASAASRAFS